MTDPADVYRERLAEREQEHARWSRRELAVSTSRLVAVVVGLVVAWLAVQNELFSLWWAVLPFALFAVLVLVHSSVLGRRDQLARAAQLYRLGLARIQDRWIEAAAEGGSDGARYAEEGSIGGVQHPYAGDLDLFGKGSLFQRLDGTRTRAGADTLARWLLEPAAVDEIRERQRAVAELAPRLELREALWTLGGALRSEMESEVLVRWAAGESRLAATRWLRWLLPVLAAANLALLVGWLFLGWRVTPFLALGLAEIVGFTWIRPRVAATIEGVDRASADLALIAALLTRVEEEPLESPWLAQRITELEHGGVSSGRSIASLQQRVDLLESRRNPLFAPLGALVLWTTQLAYAVDAWRRAHGRAVVRWLEIVGEVEALACLAGLAFEQPEDPFPEILDGETPLIEGRELGHPLLPRDRCVRNDVELAMTGPSDDVPQGYIISGSNMSGKSTYLRTCGLNVVLALAGAPVRAASLRLSPLQVAASIRMQDSLLEGASKFYAEIKRLRQILDLTGGERPVFFLLDEILNGTNSHDRRIGAEAVVKAMLRRGAIGLVTTHDLALAEIAADGSTLRNVHFEDTVEGGRVCFDYRLRAGVVEHSNALALMREIGLEV